MNKLMSKIVGLCAGFSLAIGAGVAIAMNQTEATPVKAEAANTCVVSMEDEATDKGWENGKAYTSWVESTKGIFTFTATGGGNNGKYYTSDTSWRMYNGGTATISCGDSYEIDVLAGRLHSIELKKVLDLMGFPENYRDIVRY